jgi:hypothetical protein
MTSTQEIQDAILKTLPAAWTPAVTRRPGPGQRVGRGDHRHAERVLLAGLDARHRPQGVPRIWRAAAVHRHGHPGRPTRRPGTAALPLGPVREPDPAAKDSGLRNLPCTGLPRTRSDARSSRWHANCWPGRRSSPLPDLPAAGNQSSCGSSLSPGGLSRRRPPPSAPPRPVLA